MECVQLHADTVGHVWVSGDRIWAQLEMHHHGRDALAAFLTPRYTSKAHGLSTGIGIVDAPVEALGVEDDRVRKADRCHGAQMEMPASLLSDSSRESTCSDGRAPRSAAPNLNRRMQGAA